MTTRFVKFCLPYRLPCANAVRNDIVLCLQDAALIVQPVPPCTLAITTINAKICQAFTLCDGCTNIVWNYTFSYDDTQLTNPTTPLTAADITGVFCLDCETDWIQEQISCISGGSELCVVDSSSIDFSIYEGCVTGVVKVSQDAGNEIIIHTDGIYAPTGGGGGGNDWHILGNSDIVDGTNFLGTTNNVAVDIRVNNIRARRTVPDSVCSIIIDGGATNSAVGSGCTIAGGGHSPISFANANKVQAGYFSTIGGGSGNIMIPDAVPASGFFNGFSVISGGANNIIELDVLPWVNTTNNPFQGTNTIGGGYDNLIICSDYNVISGGFFNQISYAPDFGKIVQTYIAYDAICGGQSNQILGSWNTASFGVTNEDTLGSNFIGGGNTNEIDNGFASSIVGGEFNLIYFGGIGVKPHISFYSFIGGGQQNAIQSSNNSVINGGLNNLIDGSFGNITTTSTAVSNFVGGGNTNIIETTSSIPSFLIHFDNNVISGGINNLIRNQITSFIGGGNTNKIIATNVGDGIGGLTQYNAILQGISGLIDDKGFEIVIRRNTILNGDTSKIYANNHAAFVEDNCIIGGIVNTILDSAQSVIVNGEGCTIGGVLSGDACSRCTIVNGDTCTIKRAFYSTIINGRHLNINSGTAAFSAGDPGGSTIDLSAFTGIFYVGDADLWIGNIAGTAKAIKFFEPNTVFNYSTSNYSSFKAQAQGANIDYVWPAAAGTAGQSLKILSVVGTVVTLQWA